MAQQDVPSSSSEAAGKNRALLEELKRVAGLEAQLAKRYVQRTAIQTARGAALGGAGVALGLMGLGTLAMAGGLTLAHRPATWSSVVGLTLAAASAVLVYASICALPTDALDEARRLLHLQVRTVKQDGG
jgi:hypothetical protein